MPEWVSYLPEGTFYGALLAAFAWFFRQTRMQDRRTIEGSDRLVRGLEQDIARKENDLIDADKEIAELRRDYRTLFERFNEYRIRATARELQLELLLQNNDIKIPPRIETDHEG